MDASSPLLPNLLPQDELERLDWFWYECEGLLRSWKVYDYTPEDEHTDAVIAIFTFQEEIVLRRAYLVKTLYQLPMRFFYDDPPAPPGTP